MNEYTSSSIKSTTVVAVRRRGELAISADGQATLGSTVIKSSVRKIRKLSGGEILAGFAGSCADSFTLLERFESKLREHVNNMYSAALGLASEWRSRDLRHLESVIIVANRDLILTIFGNGDVVKSDYDVAAIGSGGMYAYASALSLMRHVPDMCARDITEESLRIASDICVYTNKNIITELLSAKEKKHSGK